MEGLIIRKMAFRAIRKSMCIALSTHCNDTWAPLWKQWPKKILFHNIL